MRLSCEQSEWLINAKIGKRSCSEASGDVNTDGYADLIAGGGPRSTARRGVHSLGENRIAIAHCALIFFLAFASRNWAR